jgi:hypothetical protein
MASKHASKSSGSKSSASSATIASETASAAVSTLKSGDILINVQAKPGAKVSAISGLPFARFLDTS